MAWITPPVFVALQTLTDSVMNQLSSRLSDLWVGTTAGDTDYYSASDTKTRLALGSAGQYLGVTGSAPAWKDDGVPGLFTTAGDIPYGTGANASSRLGIGTAGQVLQTNSGATAPEWGNAASLKNRQGGSATIWSTTGTTDYTPTDASMQAGAVQVTMAGGGPSQGTATITFPAAFGYAPLIFLSCEDPLFGTIDLTVTWDLLTSSNFKIYVNYTSAAVTVGNINVHWLAIGPLA